MPRYEESIVIHRPRADVFTYMDDIDREVEWQPAIKEASQDPPGAQRVGTKRRYVSMFMGKRFENVYVNTQYQRFHRVAFESAPESAVQARGEIRVVTVPGGTQVTMIVDTDIPRALRLIPKIVFERTSRKELRASLQRLKERLEGGV